MVPVHFDELDVLGMLYNGRYHALLDRAWIQYWAHRGYVFDTSGQAPDTFALTREATIRFERPITGHGTVGVQIWIEKVGGTSVTVGFRVISADGSETYAHGTRLLVKVDPVTRRPTQWTDKARVDFERLLIATAG